MLYPMAALVLLTFVVMAIALTARIRAVKSGAMDFEFFRLMQQTELPDTVAKTTRNVSNLFEFPVLFYAAGAICLALGLDSPTFSMLGWLYVGLRVWHSVIHIGYNNVIHRLTLFLASNVVLLVIWAALVIRVR